MAELSQQMDGMSLIGRGHGKGHGLSPEVLASSKPFELLHKTHYLWCLTLLPSIISLCQLIILPCTKKCWAA